MNQGPLIACEPAGISPKRAYMQATPRQCDCSNEIRASWRMSWRKPAPGLIGGRHRFADQNMRQTKEAAACSGTEHAPAFRPTRRSTQWRYDRLTKAF